MGHPPAIRHRAQIRTRPYHPAPRTSRRPPARYFHPRRHTSSYTTNPRTLNGGTRDGDAPWQTAASEYDQKDPPAIMLASRPKVGRTRRGAGRTWGGTGWGTASVGTLCDTTLRGTSDAGERRPQLKRQRSFTAPGIPASPTLGNAETAPPGREWSDPRSSAPQPIEEPNDAGAHDERRSGCVDRAVAAAESTIGERNDREPSIARVAADLSRIAP